MVFPEVAVLDCVFITNCRVCRAFFRKRIAPRLLGLKDRLHERSGETQWRTVRILGKVIEPLVIGFATQLITCINHAESSERFHKESCDIVCQLVIIFCRRGENPSKPLTPRDVFQQCRPLFGRRFVSERFVFTVDLDGLKAICNVSHFSEVDQ